MFRVTPIYFRSALLVHLCVCVRAPACVFPAVGCPSLRNLFTSMLLFLLSVTTDDGFGCTAEGFEFFGKFHGRFCFHVGAQVVLIKVVKVEPKNIFRIVVSLGHHCFLCLVFCCTLTEHSSTQKCVCLF